MSPGEKVRLTRVKETALITLCARAQQSRAHEGVLEDPWAEEALERIDYDFGSLDVGRTRRLLLSARARQLDLWTERFLAVEHDATVLHLGCGLDSRVFRIDPPAAVRWYDVDFPDVIEIRHRIYPTRPGYTLIAGSLDRPDWLERVPRDRATVVVAEGVTQYLSEETVIGLLRRITGRFAAGRIAFDAHSRAVVRLARRTGSTVGRTGATFSWGLDNPHRLERVVPGLVLLAETRLSELARRFGLPRRLRALLRLADAIPLLRPMTCYLYRF